VKLPLQVAQLWVAFAAVLSGISRIRVVVVSICLTLSLLLGRKTIRKTGCVVSGQNQADGKVKGQVLIMLTRDE
jgi:membrane protein implicated in regulation of membrane protease activity